MAAHSIKRISFALSFLQGRHQKIPLQLSYSKVWRELVRFVHVVAAAPQEAPLPYSYGTGASLVIGDGINEGCRGSGICALTLTWNLCILIFFALGRKTKALMCSFASVAEQFNKDDMRVCAYDRRGYGWSV